MRSRNIQVFFASDLDYEELPISPSPWHRNGRARIPYEHWALILDFASSIDPAAAMNLDRLSNWGAGRIENQSAVEVKAAHEFLTNLAEALKSARPLVGTPTQSIPEAHPNEEHARMCEAVAAVMALGLLNGRQIRSWVE
jgi:hypothetical protein